MWVAWRLLENGGRPHHHTLTHSIRRVAACLRQLARNSPSAIRFDDHAGEARPRNSSRAIACGLLIGRSAQKL